MLRVRGRAISEQCAMFGLLHLAYHASVYNDLIVSHDDGGCRFDLRTELQQCDALQWLCCSGQP